jgi:hypothetical protein
LARQQWRCVRLASINHQPTNVCYGYVRCGISLGLCAPYRAPSLHSVQLWLTHTTQAVRCLAYLSTAVCGSVTQTLLRGVCVCACAVLCAVHLLGTVRDVQCMCWRVPLPNMLRQMRFYLLSCHSGCYVIQDAISGGMGMHSTLKG